MKEENFWSFSNSHMRQAMQEAGELISFVHLQSAQNPAEKHAWAPIAALPQNEIASVIVMHNFMKEQSASPKEVAMLLSNETQRKNKPFQEICIQALNKFSAKSEWKKQKTHKELASISKTEEKEIDILFSLMKLEEMGVQPFVEQICSGQEIDKKLDAIIEKNAKEK